MESVSGIRISARRATRTSLICYSARERIQPHPTSHARLKQAANNNRNGRNSKLGGRNTRNAAARTVAMRTRNGCPFAKSRKMHVRFGHKVELVAPTTDAAKKSWRPARPAVRAARPSELSARCASTCRAAKVCSRCAMTKSSMPADQSADSMPQADSIRLFLCGDVMTGRGIDQVLPHPNDPTLHEPYIGDARLLRKTRERYPSGELHG